MSTKIKLIYKNTSRLSTIRHLNNQSAIITKIDRIKVNITYLIFSAIVTDIKNSSTTNTKRTRQIRTRQFRDAQIRSNFRNISTCARFIGTLTHGTSILSPNIPGRSTNRTSQKRCLLVVSETSRNSNGTAHNNRTVKPTSLVRSQITFGSTDPTKCIGINTFITAKIILVFITVIESGVIKFRSVIGFDTFCTPKFELCQVIPVVCTDIHRCLSH